MKIIHKILIILLICIILFYIFYYKNFFSGNNISIKNKKEIIEEILNGKLKYKSRIIVKIISNKNEHIYEMIQEETDKTSYQEVISEGNIKNLRIVYTDNVLRVENSELNLEKIYKDYEPIMSNYLFLNDFANDYLSVDEKNIEEIEEYILIKLKIENTNKYIKYKELYLNEKNGLPMKLIIKDSDKLPRVCIEYTNIEIL